MNDIKPIIFLVPLIVFTVTSIFYFILLKRSADKSAFKRFVLNVIIFSFFLNLVWELVQLPLYRASMYDVKHTSFCALASIADVLMVLLMYDVFAFIFNDSLWVQKLTWPRLVFVMLTGGTGAIVSEKRHLLLGSWAYADAMPLLPFVHVGIAPVLQFMLLPYVIFYLSYNHKKDGGFKINNGT